ncbi:hypothetical protein AHF37_12684 [Paragonimus kellicotti]|nr:hypothetical protein AHF37_12684 [Paragonimus kellicotti]
MSPLSNHNDFEIPQDHLIEGTSVAETVAHTVLVNQTSSYFGYVCQTAVTTTSVSPWSKIQLKVISIPLLSSSSFNLRKPNHPET